jgi:hypothetical protein
MKKELKECRKANLQLQDQVDELLVKIEAIEESREPQTGKDVGLVDENEVMRSDSPHHTQSPPALPAAGSDTNNQNEPVVMNNAPIDHKKKKKNRKSKKRRQKQSQHAAQNSTQNSVPSPSLHQSDQLRNRVKYYVGGIHPKCMVQDLITFATKAGLSVRPEDVKTLTTHRDLSVPECRGVSI